MEAKKIFWFFSLNKCKSKFDSTSKLCLDKSKFLLIIIKDNHYHYHDHHFLMFNQPYLRSFEFQKLLFAPDDQDEEEKKNQRMKRESWKEEGRRLDERKDEEEENDN